MRIKKDWGRYRPWMFVLAVAGALSLCAAVESLVAQETKTPEATPPAAAAAAATPAAPATPPPAKPDSTGANAGGEDDVPVADAKGE